MGSALTPFSHFAGPFRENREGAEQGFPMLGEGLGPALR